MVQQKIPIITNEIYHVFNRSIAKEKIYKENNWIKRALTLINYYRYSQKLRFSKFNKLTELQKVDYLNNLYIQTPQVEIYTYALMPNHHHFLLKQTQDNGIKKFISNYQNSYAKVYNLKKDRQGSLFQKSYKVKHILNEEQFIHVSRYIHLNPVTDKLLTFKQLINTSTTSFSQYAGDTGKGFVNTNNILSIFRTKERYYKFVFNQISYQRNLARIKKILLD